MDALLVILRILTLVARVALAVCLVAMLVRRAELPPPSRWGWMLAAVIFATITFDNVLIEALGVVRRSLITDDWFVAVYRRIYFCAYLLNRVLVTLFPFWLIAFFSGPGTRRRLLPGAAGVVGLLVALALWNGALTDWAELMTWNQRLSILGIPGYLGFCALVVLGELSSVDRYLFAFVVVRAAFEVLIPVQEAFFHDLGLEAASRVWHVFQFLQLAATGAQVVIVLKAWQTLVRGRVVRQFDLAG